MRRTLASLMVGWSLIGGLTSAVADEPSTLAEQIEAALAPRHQLGTTKAIADQLTKWKPERPPVGGSAPTAIQVGKDFQSQPRTSVDPGRRDSADRSLEWVSVDSNGATDAFNGNPSVIQTTANPTSTASPVIESNSFVAEQLKRLRKPIQQIGVSTFQSTQPMPIDRATELFGTEEPQTIQSEAPGPVISDRYPVLMCHAPLYFEQANLERCGNTLGYFQNAVSVARFTRQTICLPFQVCRHRDQRCIKAGPDCRTCDAIDDCKCGVTPFDAAATTTEAATLLGFSFLLL